MRKFSSIWAELGYVAGLEDGKDIGIKKGEDIGLKKGEDIGLKKGEDIGLKKGEDIGFKKRIKYEKQLKEENEKKAIKSALENTALKMLKKGISIEEISDFTGLSIEDVQVLKKKVENEDR